MQNENKKVKRQETEKNRFWLTKIQQKNRKHARLHEITCRQIAMQCNAIQYHVLHFVYMQFKGSVEWCVCVSRKSLLLVSNAAVSFNQKNSATIPKTVGTVLLWGWRNAFTFYHRYLCHFVEKFNCLFFLVVFVFILSFCLTHMYSPKPKNFFVTFVSVSIIMQTPALIHWSFASNFQTRQNDGNDDDNNNIDKYGDESDGLVYLFNS